MSLPIKSSRATGVATDDPRSAPLRKLLTSEAVDFTPKRSFSWKKLISPISTSLAVHAAILFILSWIYFDLPNNKVFETILTLVVGDNGSSGDAVEINIGELKEPTIEDGGPAIAEIGEIGEIETEIMAFGDDVEPPSLMNVNSESIPGGDRTPGGKKS